MTPQKEHTFSLGDDGTLDTVVFCDDCGEELRFNFDGCWEEYHIPTAENCDCYTKFIEDCLQDASDDHECEKDGNS